jgi:anti-sigma factor RsiW
MNNVDAPQWITDEQLGAYVDGELDSAARARVDALLLKDEDARHRLTAIREITQLVRDATHYTGRSPSRAGSDTAVPRNRAASTSARGPGWMGWRLAASFVGGALAVALTFQLLETPAAPHGWQQSALVFHNTYLQALADGKERFLVDLTNPGTEEAANAYSSILDYQPVLPDLSVHEYSPTGARLVTSSDGPTVFVIYDAPGRSPVGFSVTRATPASRAAPTTSSLHDVRLVSWSDGEFDYAMSSDLSADALNSLATTAQRSLSTDEALPTL